MKLSKVASGGLFRLHNRIRGTVASGVTGNILTLTAPAGQIARLVLLVCSSTTSQSGISVVRDGVTALTGILADNDSNPGGTFFVSEVWNAGNSGPAQNANDICIKEVVGNSIVISKNAGNTTQAIEYAVEYGVMQ